MALVAELDVPTFAPPGTSEPRAALWIARDFPPFEAIPWPVLVPIPLGYHEVSPTEADRINRRLPTAVTFILPPEPSDVAPEVAALSTAGPSPAVVAARRPPRAPREPRAPRPARAARPPRPARPARVERAPRAARRPRPPRRARAIRPIRPPRPKNYKTRQAPGICKGPGCTCWTPAGCAPPDYIHVFGDYTKTDCYRGPCFSYEACVSDKCQVHANCAINEIIRFWATRYQAVAAYVAPVTAPLMTAARIAARALPGIGVLQQVGALLEGMPAGAVQIGCAPGEYWTIGLTGARCVPVGSGLRAATQAEVIAILGQAQWDVLVAQGSQGQMG